MKNIVLVFLAFFGLQSLVFAQKSDEGHSIEFEIKDYPNDTLVIGYYYGDRHLVQDTLSPFKKDHFKLEGPEKLKSGVYLMLTHPENQFIQFMVNDIDQEFKLKTDFNNLQDIRFKGSKDNDLFYDYMAFIGSMRPKAATINEKIKALEADHPDVKKHQADLDKLDEEVEAHQAKVINENPKSITSLLVKGNLPIDVPDYEGTEKEQRDLQFEYYREHFFDNIELDNPASLRTPFLHTKIEDFISKLTVQIPDSISNSIDYILDKVEPAEDTYKFYLSHFLNDAAKSRIVGYDAIYVHLMDNYYSRGKAPWADEENLKKLQKNANRLRPVLIGKTVEDITLYKEDESPFKLSDVKTKYTVIMFWAPDCGHCKKSMPAAIEFNENFKEKDVTFLAVCTKNGEKYKSCWEAIEEKNMKGFVNLGDEFAKSRFKSKFNVRTTPKTFILNQDREILIKNVGTDQLEDIMNEIIATDKREERRAQ